MKLNIPKLIQNALNLLRKKIGAKTQDKTLVVEMSDLSNSLEAINTGVEDNFLNLGQKFQLIFSKTEALKSLVIKTSDFSDSKTDGSGITGVGEFARKSLQTLTGYQGDILSNLEILNSGSDHLETLSGMCTTTDKLSSLLNVIALNIAIECNRSAESREMFMVFVKEVKEISKQISRVSQELYTDSTEIRKKQIQYYQEISGKHNQLQRLTRSAETVVNKSVKTIEDIINKSLSSLERASGCSGDINTMVSSIVMAMQFHDIVRQQIEHVVSAIDGAVELHANSGAELKDSDSEQTIMGKTHSALMIQNAQIKSTIGEIDATYKNIMSSFEGIESKIAELLSCVSFSTSEQSVEDDDDNLFSIVLSGFENLNKLLGDAYQLNISMNDVAGEAAAATDGLLKHVEYVQKISLDLHRKALNAIIKAAHLGDMGRALEVFAHEVTTASNESDTFADKVVEHIEAISSLTEQMSRVQGDKANVDKVELSKITSIDSLSTSYETFMKNTNTTLSMSNELETLIEETKSSLSFISTFSDDLKIQLEKSEEILSGLNITTEFNALAADIAKTPEIYTMESERRVHLSLLNRTKPDEATGEVEASKDDDLNIELFDEPAVDDFELPPPETLDEHPIQSQPTEDTASDNKTVTPDKKDESEVEFDDNIELF